MPSTIELPPGYDVRPVRLSDAGPLAAAYVRNREHLAPWEPTRPADFFTPAGQQQVVRGQLEGMRVGDQAAWVLTRGEQVVGRVVLSNVVRAVFCSASLGYWVDHEHVRRGLARAAGGTTTSTSGCCTTTRHPTSRAEAGPPQITHVCTRHAVLPCAAA